MTRPWGFQDDGYDYDGDSVRAVPRVELALPAPVAVELVEPGASGFVCPLAFDELVEPGASGFVCPLAFDYQVDLFEPEAQRQVQLLEDEVQRTFDPAVWADVVDAPLQQLLPPPASAPILVTPGQPAVCAACLHRHTQLRPTEPRGGHGACDVCGRVRWRVGVEVQGVQEARARRVASEDDKG